MRISRRLICQRLRCGSLKLTPVTTPSGNYRIGHYTHPLGIVTVHCESRVTFLTTVHNGQLYSRSRTDHPSDGQISRACRQLLIDTQTPVLA